MIYKDKATEEQTLLVAVQNILVKKNIALVSVMKYLLDKLKVLNIYNVPVQ